MNDTMHAAVLHGSRDIRLEKVAISQPRNDEVLLRVRRVGICGSDVHYYKHGYCGAFVPTRPFILGHELVGTVQSTGKEVTFPEVGQRVVVNPAASCGHCRPCKAGRSNLCRRVVMLGSASSTPPTDGAFAEYLCVPGRQCHAIPDSMTDDVAALMEPLSVALHAIARANGVVGSRVLVCGAGPIGLLTVLATRALGACLVAVSEPQPHRRRSVLELGADEVLDPTAEDFEERARSVSEGGFDVVFEASGATPAVQSALQVSNRGGTIIQIGTIGTNEVLLPVNELMVRELSFLGTFRYSDEFTQAIDLTSRGRFNLSPLITRVFPLKEISVAMEHACSAQDVIKVQVTTDNTL